MRRAAQLAAAVLLGTGLFGIPAARAAVSQSSLPAVPSGHRPGPDVLYAAPPRAPQLENHDPRFHAPFVPVSGTEVYTGGEYIYTDHLYDDFGSDTDGAGSNALSISAGDISYPPDAKRYGSNAADLFEFRIAPGASDVAYRVALNTLLAPDTTMAVIAFDSDDNVATGSPTLARDPGAPFPGTDAALYMWGTGAEWSRWNGTKWVATPVAAGVDLETNQITAVVPRAVADPAGKWRATLGVGLRAADGQWLRPDSSGPTDQNPCAIYNLGFRFDEPVTTKDTPPDTNQAAALRAHAPTRYAHDIDFAALASRAERSSVPSHGTMVRYFPSRLHLGEGRDSSAFPGFHGQLEPYSIYVPTQYRSGTPAALTLNLHSLSEFHWQYNGSTGVQQMGEQRRNIVATAMARGDDGWYQHEAEYDVFEMWNDIASHYTLDPDRTVVTGYSMGGYATYRLGTLYPDLFGRAMSVVGPPADGVWVPPLPPSGGNDTLTNAWLENARNLPYLNVAAGQDELVPVAGTAQQNIGRAVNGMTSFDVLGYRFRYDLYQPAEHLTLAVLGYNLPQAVEFLGDGRVDRNPVHVTFAYAPDADDAKLGLVHDHAYWVSGVRLADRAAGTPIAKAVVDVRSLASGVGDPPSSSDVSAGVAPIPYTEVGRSWGTAPAIGKQNKLVITLSNVGAADIDAVRAGLDTTRVVELDVDATAGGVLRVAGTAGRVVSIPISAGHHSASIAAGQLEAVAPAVLGRTVLPVTGGEQRPDLLIVAVAVSIVIFVGRARRLRGHSGR